MRSGHTAGPGESGTKQVCPWAGCGTGHRKKPEDSKNVGLSNRKAGINICSGGEKTENLVEDQVSALFMSGLRFLSDLKVEMWNRT